MATGSDGEGPASPGEPSSEPSSFLERMVEDLGGWHAVAERPELLSAQVVVQETGPLRPGVMVADRYLVGEPLLAPAQGTFRASDSTTRQPVLITFLTGMSLDPSLTARFGVARAVSHGNVCRVHDLVPTPWGPAVIMEGLEGETLAARVAAVRSRGGIDVDKFRRVASDLFSALTAIHAQGVVHGGLDSGSVLLTDRKAVVLDLGFRGPPPSLVAQEPTTLARAMADDVRRAALVCWDMWSTLPPSPLTQPRSAPLRDHPLSELPSRLSVDELRQMFDALSEDPAERPPARNVRFVESDTKTPSAIPTRHSVSPGPPPGLTLTSFAPGAQGLLVMFAETAPETVGRLLPMSKASFTIGRSEEADVTVAEKTVSYVHARLSWQRGSSIVEDLGSTNGTFTEDGYTRQTRTLLRHGQQIMLGEMRLMLVAFADGSAAHHAARHWLARRDPVTGLLSGEWLSHGLAADARFSDWADLAMVQATFRVESQVGRREDRLAILELLALFRVARRVTEFTDMLLLSTRPVVAGRAVEPGPNPARVDAFVVSIVAAGEAHVRNVIDLVVTDARHLLPPSFNLSVSVEVRVPGAAIAVHIGPDSARAGQRPPALRS